MQAGWGIPDIIYFQRYPEISAHTEVLPVRASQRLTSLIRELLRFLHNCSLFKMQLSWPQKCLVMLSHPHEHIVFQDLTHSGLSVLGSSGHIHFSVRVCVQGQFW